MDSQTFNETSIKQNQIENLEEVEEELSRVENSNKKLVEDIEVKVHKKVDPAKGKNKDLDNVISHENNEK